MEFPAFGPFHSLLSLLWIFLQIEKKRGSRVITLIHRQEMLGFLGIPIFRYISIEDSEQVLRAIKMTPPDMSIDLIVHTPGGLALLGPVDPQIGQVPAASMLKVLEEKETKDITEELAT